MECGTCRAPNDADAAFCIQCGRPLSDEGPGKPFLHRRAYVFALLILPVLILAAAAGYYKFFLPDGVAAVVNGEEIGLSELDAAVFRMTGAAPEATAGSPRSEELGRLRHQVLNQLITERVVLQAARKAGLQVSKQEITAAATGMRNAAHMDEAGFAAAVVDWYGSPRAFERKLENDLLISRYIAEQVAPAGAEAGAARAAVNRWVQKSLRNASVRISISEQWSAAGCSCCSGGAASKPGAQGSQGSMQAAADAGLRYWNERYGGGPATAKTTDLGCHVQVDIVRENRVLLVLRYQDGVISEQ